MAGNKRPNILFIVTDDQRYGTIAALGNDEISTPNIDALVRRGVSFTNAHIPGGTASAVCMPSRAMINTGRTLFHLTDCGKSIPECDTTLGECFRAGGYHTAGIGKWHNGPDSYARSFDSGADIFFGGMWDHWNVPVNDFRPDGVYDHEIKFTPNFTANEIPVTVLADRVNAGVHSSELFADSAAGYIHDYASDDPFLLYLAFLAPHDPRTMPEKFRNMYDPDIITLPPNYAPTPNVSFGWAAGGRDENTEVYPRTPERIKRHIADYYAMISHLDDCIGRVIDALRERDMLDNTVIVLCGDNGLAVGQHGLMGKQNLYEHSIRVPLLVSGPGVPAGQTRDGLVCLYDIFPTLCDMCGLTCPPSVDGKSFVPMLGSAEATGRDELYLAFQSRLRGVIADGYKLIEYRTEDLKLTQLFDLHSDPWETQNLFGLPGRADIVARLRERLFALCREWGDEDTIFGRQFWLQWRQYEDAAVRGIPGPKGANMATQVASWGTGNKSGSKKS